MYAILVGREQKVVETWADCQALTKGYPKNKFQKVRDEEEGVHLIESFNSTVVEKQGYEDKRYHVFSSIPKTRHTANTVISVRLNQEIKGYGVAKQISTRVICIIKSPKKLDLPQAKDVVSWDKIPRYIFESELKGLYSDKPTSLLITLTSLLDLLSKEIEDLSVLINTDSNYLISLLSKNILNRFDVRLITDVKYEDLIKDLYTVVMTTNGVSLNYEARDRVSLESHYSSLYLKGEFDIYDLGEN